jgi:hypothetical protein
MMQSKNKFKFVKVLKWPRQNWGMTVMQTRQNEDFRDQNLHISEVLIQLLKGNRDTICLQFSLKSILTNEHNKL